MNKLSTFVFFIAVAYLGLFAPTLNAASVTPSPADFAACDPVDRAVRDKCCEHISPELNNMKDWSLMAKHPQLCCPAYKIFVCIREGIEKADVCKKVWPVKKLEFQEDMKNLAKYGCHVSKCA